MKSCRNIKIIVNEAKDKGLLYAKKTAELIEKRGGQTQIFSTADYDDIGRIDTSFLIGADCVIVLGGDGTFLRVSHVATQVDIPMIGVNLGTVGFLTEVLVSELENMINRLMSGDYIIEERMMLSGRVLRNGEVVCEGLQALNDAVLARKTLMRLISVVIYVNDHYFDEMEADGLIVATPTGSTSYNLSAGGPIVRPGAKLLVLTPIAPFSLTGRSVVFGADDKLSFKFVNKRNNGQEYGLLSFDGYRNVEVRTNDIAEFSMSDKSVKLIKLEDVSVYEILKKKLID